MWWITPPNWSALWAQTPVVTAHCTAPKYCDPHNDWPVILTVMLVSDSPMIKPACSGSGQCQCDNVHKSSSLSCFWLVETTFLTVCTHIQIISNRNQSNLFTVNHIHFFKKPTGHHNTPHFQNLHAHVHIIININIKTKQHKITKHQKYQ